MKRYIYKLTPEEGAVRVEETVNRWLKENKIPCDDNKRHLLIVDDTVTANTVAVHCKNKEVPKVLAYLSEQEHGVISELAYDKSKEIVFATMDFTRGKIPFGSYNDLKGKLVPINDDTSKRNKK